MIDKNYGKFWYGALGGITPAIAGLATTYLAVPETAMPTIGILLGLAGAAFVGGIVAIGFVKDPEVRHAIFAGIAAPSIIANIISGATPPGNVQNSQADWFTSSAYAQAVTEPVTPGNGVVIVSPDVTGPYPSGEISVFAKMSDGAVQKIGNVTNFVSDTAFEVPKGAAQITIGSGSVNIDQAVSRVNLSIQSGPTIYNDFWWALGAKREYGIKSTAIGKKPAP